MKKSFLTVMLVMGVVGVNSMADDTITISGTVLPAAVVGFSDVSSETLNENDRFIDAVINIGTGEPNEGFTVTPSHFYVKSNNPNGVSISITPHTGENSSGHLTGETGEILGMQYFIGGFNSYSMSSSPTVSLTTGPTNGTEEGKSFSIVANVPDTQTAGIYDTVLDVTVICP